MVRTRLANGLVEEARADPTDGRTVERVVRRDGAALLHRRYRYDAAGRIVDDGRSRYRYDEQSRVTAARQPDGGWSTTTTTAGTSTASPGWASRNPRRATCA